MNSTYNKRFSSQVMSFRDLYLSDFNRLDAEEGAYKVHINGVTTRYHNYPDAVHAYSKGSGRKSIIFKGSILRYSDSGFVSNNP